MCDINGIISADSPQPLNWDAEKKMTKSDQTFDHETGTLADALKGC